MEAALLILALAAVIALWHRSSQIEDRLAALDQEIETLRGRLRILTEEAAAAPGDPETAAPDVAGPERAPETANAATVDPAPRADIPSDGATDDVPAGVPPRSAADGPAKDTAPSPAAATPRVPAPVWRSPAELSASLRPDAAPAGTPRRDSPPEPTGPALRERLSGTLRDSIRIGPDDPDMGWEMALGTYWLPRIGVGALAIAVAFLLTLAINRGGPVTRIGIGYGVCVTLLGLAWQLEGAYRAYARVLFSGGLALSYLVTYATWFLPLTRLPFLGGPTPTLGALVAVVAGWALFAQRRRSPTVAVLVTVLGHLTICLSTLSTETPIWYSIVGLLALAAGSAFFLLANRWYYVAALGVAGSYLNHWLVMARSEPITATGQFVLALAVLAAYWAIFTLAELFAAERLRRERVPLWFRTSLATFNTACFFGLASLLVREWPGADDPQHLLRYAMAAVMILTAWVYRVRRAGDPLFNAYWTKGIVLVTLGLAAQFSGQSLSAWLAVQMLALLVTARQNDLLVTRLLALGAAVVAFAQASWTIVVMAPAAYGEAGYAALAVQAAFTALAFLAMSVLYERTDWAAPDPDSLPLSRHSLARLWKLDLVSKPPEGLAVARPFGGLLFPHALALAGVALWIGWAFRLVPLLDRSLLVAGSALALVLAARWLRSAPAGHGTAWLTAAGFAWAMLLLLESTGVRSSDPEHAMLVLRLGLIVAMTLGLAELWRHSSTDRSPYAALFPGLGTPVVLPGEDADRQADDDAGAQQATLPFLALIGVAALVASTAGALYDAPQRLLLTAAAALVLTALARQLGSLPFGVGSMLLATAAALFGSHHLMSTADAAWAGGVAASLGGLVSLALMALFSERWLVGRRLGLGFHQTLASPYLLYSIVLWLTGLFLTRQFEAPGDGWSLAVAAVVATALGQRLHRHAMAWGSVALLVWAQALWHLAGVDSPPEEQRLLAGVLVALAVAGERLYAALRIEGVGPLLLVSAWPVVMSQLIAEAGDSGWASFLWALAALAWLGFGRLVDSRTAVGLGVLTTVCATILHISQASLVDLAFAPLTAGFLGTAALWILLERGGAAAGPEARRAVPDLVGGLCVAIATWLLMFLCTQLPQTREFYLTISWSGLGFLLFLLGGTWRQKWYRWASLAVMTMASLRVAFIDTRTLDAVPRIFAWAVLGAVLIALGYGYVRALAEAREAEAAEDREKA